MTNTAEKVSDFDKKYGNYLIGKEGEYKCNKCKKIWIPTNDDINRKAMHTYYKCCSKCRLYLYNYGINRKNNKDNQI